MVWPPQNTGNFDFKLVGVCSCCPGGKTVKLFCRTRGGTATLCGNDEFGTPSSPPKRYREVTFQNATGGGTGTWSVSKYAGAGSCTPGTVVCCATKFSGTTSALYQGQTILDALTCLPNPLASNHLRRNGVDLAFDHAFHVDSGDNPAYITQTDTSTTIRLWSYTGAFNAVTLCSPKSPNPTNEVVSGGVSWLLSQEDTNAHAIARVQNNNAWTSFALAAQCPASFQQRVSGFSFFWQEAEYRLDVHADPSTHYTVTVDVYRAVYGSGVYSLLSTLSFGVTTDVHGDASVTSAVPNLSGFDTYVTNPIIL